jgi:tRNA pseudouridine32 synthase/23S rRNA pseudouridine746 synthase
MTISKFPSTVLMPKKEKPYPSILDFLAHRFAFIKRETWEERILSGKVLNEQGDPICLETVYIPLGRLQYFREVEKEPAIPFAEEIIFCNEELLVACKPHFLPVIPGGPYVDECLLNRLKKTTGNQNLSPINRIDRGTAGLVLFSMNKKSRGPYQELFMNHGVKKTYYAVTKSPGFLVKNSLFGKDSLDKDSLDKEGFPKAISVENRIIQASPWFRMKTVPGNPNSLSEISLIKTEGSLALFKLSPVTGKKHQLRLHLSELGFPILNDKYYPKLLPQAKDDFNIPLQLLAQKIQFEDPFSGKQVSYESGRHLFLY